MTAILYAGFVPDMALHWLDIQGSDTVGCSRRYLLFCFWQGLWSAQNMVQQGETPRTRCYVRCEYPGGAIGGDVTGENAPPTFHQSICGRKDLAHKLPRAVFVISRQKERTEGQIQHSTKNSTCNQNPCGEEFQTQRSSNSHAWRFQMFQSDYEQQEGGSLLSTKWSQILLCILWMAVIFVNSFIVGCLVLTTQIPCPLKSQVRSGRVWYPVVVDSIL